VRRGWEEYNTGISETWQEVRKKKVKGKEVSQKENGDTSEEGGAR